MTNSYKSQTGLNAVSAALLVAGALFSAGTQAQSFSGADGTLAASATFVSHAGYFDVTLTNTQFALVQGAGNELTGISFDTTADLAGAGQSLYQSGDLVEVTGALSKNQVADPAANAAGFGWDWRGTNYLSALDGDVGENGPDLGLINASALTFGSSLYGGNGSHNPLYQGATTFRVWDSDVTAGTVFSNVLFHFNTDGETTLCARGSDCTPTTLVPEPETYALMLAGLGAVAFMARRRRQG